MREKNVRNWMIIISGSPRSVKAGTPGKHYDFQLLTQFSWFCSECQGTFWDNTLKSTVTLHRLRNSPLSMTLPFDTTLHSWERVFVNSVDVTLWSPESKPVSKSLQIRFTGAQYVCTVSATYWLDNLKEDIFKLKIKSRWSKTTSQQRKYL